VKWNRRNHYCLASSHDGDVRIWDKRVIMSFCYLLHQDCIIILGVVYQSDLCLTANLFTYHLKVWEQEFVSNFTKNFFVKNAVLLNFLFIEES